MNVEFSERTASFLLPGWRTWACALMLFVMAEPANAQPDVVIHSVQASRDEGVYYLDVRLDYQLSDAMKDAAQNGMALTFLVEIELRRERDYLWDSAVASLTQRYRLNYQPLTRNYLVQNLNSGAQYFLPTLDTALAVAGAVIKWPLIDSNLLADDAHYYGRLRAGLDVDDLPIPLRLQSYLALAPGWKMTSDWVVWKLP